jgi:DHA2 family multidrug resistance protein
MFLGSLTVILEEGQREYWFDSPLITRLTFVSALGFLFVMYSQLTHPHPVGKLRLLLNCSYRAVFGIVMMIGVGSFTMLYVVPVFLGIISGYNAEQTGAVAMYTGLTTFLMMPLMMVMLQKIDIRIIIGIGMAIFGSSCLMTLGLTPDSVGHDFVWQQFVNGIGQPMVGLTLSQAATAGLKDDEIPDGTALFSMARNLGGSIGLALTGIPIDRRTAFQIHELGQATTANSAAAQERVALLAHDMLRDGADPAYATARALKMIAAEVQRQALVMSYIDGFWLMGIGIILAIPAVLLLKRPKPGAAGMTH